MGRTSWPSTTYVRTLVGFVYTAFVIDSYSRKTLGWRARAEALDEKLSAIEASVATTGLTQAVKASFL